MESTAILKKLLRYFRRSWLICLYIAAAFSWLKTDSAFLFCLTVSAVCIWLAWHYRALLALVVRNKVAVFLYSVVILFIAKTYAEKLLNNQFGIEPDYIKNAAIVYGAFLSVPLTIALIALTLVVALGAVYVIAFFEGFLPNSVKKISHHPLWQSWPYLITGCFMVMLTMGSIQEKMARAALLADAYPISRCGPERQNILYVQKSETGCLTLEARFSPRKFVYDIRPSELPSGDQPGANHQ